MATALTGQQVGASGTYYDDALKNFYLPVIKEQFQKKSVLYMNVEKSAKGLDAEGRYLRGTVSKAGTSGIGAKPEGYILPTKGYERLEEFTVYMKYNYGRIEVKNSTSLLVQRWASKIFLNSVKLLGNLRTIPSEVPAMGNV